MACSPCEARRKQQQEQAKIIENLRYAPRPSNGNSGSQQQNNTQTPASNKFQSPTVLPPLR